MFRNNLTISFKTPLKFDENNFKTWLETNCFKTICLKTTLIFVLKHVLYLFFSNFKGDLKQILMLFSNVF